MRWLPDILNFLIPQKENRYRPRILGRRAVKAALAMMLVGELFFLSGMQYLVPQSSLFAVIFTNALIDGANHNRIVHRLPELRPNHLLEAAARAKALDMAEKGYFAHISPAGTTPWYWFEMVGYEFSYAGGRISP